jgi:hypothetical protein
LPGDIRVSFEFFPPKTDALMAQLWDVVETLAPLQPEFVSVTYGAGGSTRDRTHDTVARIIREARLPAAAHLTCVDASKAEIRAVAEAYWEAGVRHIVALRGDMGAPGVPFTPHPDGYANAAELVAGLKTIAPFDISVAAYPKATRIRPARKPISTTSSASWMQARAARSASSSSSRKPSSAFRTAGRRRDRRAGAAGHPAGVQLCPDAQVCRRLRRAAGGWKACLPGSTPTRPRASWSPPRFRRNSAAASMPAACAISISTRSTAPS